MDRDGPNKISALFALNSIANTRHTITCFVIPYSVDTMHHSFKGFTSYQHRLQQNIAAVIHASATASTDAIDEKLLAVN